MIDVTLYTRPGCHLCEEAKREMRAARSCAGRFQLTEVNIDTDPELRRRYGYDIPVIMINGREAFRHRLTAAEFAAEIERA